MFIEIGSAGLQCRILGNTAAAAAGDLAGQTPALAVGIQGTGTALRLGTGGRALPLAAHARRDVATGKRIDRAVRLAAGGPFPM